LSTLRKVLPPCAVVLLLAAMPPHLMAAERETPANIRAAAVGWFSGFWHELAALFASGTTSPPTKPVGGPTTDGSCAVDPNGGCYGG
jgi:hypothetical protein